MKTLLKILLPFFIALGANAQSVYNIQGDTVKMSGFGTKPANLIMKNPFSYRRGGYLQIGTGNLTKWNYAIDSAYSLGGVLYLVRSTHDTISIAISGTVGVSSVGAGFGTNFPNITTTGSVVVDSFTIATRLRVQKQIDSLATLIGSGGVTSVAAGFGTNFSTITTTGSIIIDSFTIATRLRVKKQIDSLSALLSSYTPTARTLTHSSGFGTTVTGGTQDMSANRTWSYLTDSTSGGLLSWVRGKKLADSLGVIIATKGVGSVTSVAAGYGLNFTTITGSGSVISDTFAMATRARVQKPIDSLGVVIATKGSGTVTNVGSGFGTVFTAITTTGNVIIDSFTMATRARVQKPIDSLDAAIVAGYVPVTRTVAGFALSGNITLASHTVGYGLSGSAYNGSSAIAWAADSTSGGVLSWVRGKKIIDSLGVVIATKGTGSVTSVASGFGTTFSTITTTGTVVGDSTSGGFESWVRGLKVKDSLIAWGNSTFVPQTRTVAGFALSSNVTLANLTATDGTLTFSGTYNGSTARTIGLNLGNTNNWTAAINEAKGADIASGTTTDIGAATGNYIDVTGTTTITGLGTVQAGTRRIVRFTGALTLTHNATSLILPGAANITTVAGDVATFVSLGSGNWRCTNYTKTTWTGTGGQVFATTPTIATPDITTGFTIGTAAASGKFIIGNGTNFVASTSTIPTDAGSTAGKILRSDGTNYVLSTPTFANTATSNKVLVGDGTNFVLSTPTIPLTSSPSAGKIMIGDGTNWVASTPTYPNASATTRKIIVSDGTNWVASTETYAVPGTSGNILTSDGTNWTSAAPVVTASSTNTFTNKRWTARIGSTASSGTPTINTDNTDIYEITALAAAITSFTTNLSGTPNDGDAFEIQITDNGTARAITWGASFVNGTVSLPTTTVISTTLTVDLKYYSTSSFGNGKWVCVAYY